MEKYNNDFPDTMSCILFEKSIIVKRLFIKPLTHGKQIFTRTCYARYSPEHMVCLVGINTVKMTPSVLPILLLVQMVNQQIGMPEATIFIFPSI